VLTVIVAAAAVPAVAADTVKSTGSSRRGRSIESSWDVVFGSADPGEPMSLAYNGRPLEKLLT
jgi:hypothetical protein